MTDESPDESQRLTLRNHIAEQIKVCTKPLELDALTRAWKNLEPPQAAGPTGSIAEWTMADTFRQMTDNATKARKSAGRARDGAAARRKREEARRTEEQNRTEE